QKRANTHERTQTHTETHKNAQKRANTHERTQTHTETHKNAQKRANTQERTQTHTETHKNAQKRANTLATYGERIPDPLCPPLFECNQKRKSLIVLRIEHQEV
uniref:Uncharacterized protein n=1 Tax=Parascaris univalens TaxID=6257 RepID=A0A914ZPK8_PARUN